MSGSTKEIRTKIHSIQNTKKITRAMEMVAASKMRRVQARMQKTRPYAEKTLKVIQHMAMSHSEYKHPYLCSREVNKIGYIVVSTDRGLCGGLNSNLFRKLVYRLQKNKDEGVPVSLCLFGKKAQVFFQNIGLPIDGLETDIGDNPKLERVLGVVNIMLQKYDAGEIDKLYIVYNKFINTMTQEPMVQQLVPLERIEEDKELSFYWDYIYEPDSKILMDFILCRYIEVEVFQAIVENIACEQAARMVAMKSASDNAEDLIKSCQVIYNKARQAAITQEIAEIIGGAAAV